jgi:PhnB protein
MKMPAPRPTKPVSPVPEGHRTLTPYLICDGAAAAMDFYRQAFGAEETFRMEGPAGKIGHAEMRVGDSVFMLADSNPEVGARSPQQLGGSPVSLLLYAPDVDAVVERAVKAGAKLFAPVEDKFYGDRMGGVQDPFGHRWYVGTHVEDVSPDELKRRAAAAAPH